jgi:hypothetical protein
MAKAEEGGIAGWIWLVLAAAMVVAMGSMWIPQFQDGYRPFMSFKSTQGVMKEANIFVCSTSRKNKRVAMGPRVRYEYTVDGVVHTGSQYALGLLCASNGEAADAIKGYAPDTPVTVYYSVKRPSFAVLHRESTSGSIFCNTVALLIFAGAVIAWRRSRP